MAAAAERAKLVRRNGWALAWLATAFGVTIIAAHIESHSARFASPSWQYALQVPGSPATWGVVILASGLILLYACWKRDRCAYTVGFTIGFFWFCALDGTAVMAFVADLADDDPTNTVNPLSISAWTYLAWMYGSRRRLTSYDVG